MTKDSEELLLEKTISHVRYSIWRFCLWSTDWGTYDEIDAAVECGELVPGVFPEGLAPDVEK